jgi:hypothetical protein
MVGGQARAFDLFSPSFNIRLHGLFLIFAQVTGWLKVGRGSGLIVNDFVVHIVFLIQTLLKLDDIIRSEEHDHATDLA